MAEGAPFSVSVVTPERAVFDGEVEMLVVPGEAGEIGVLARHVALDALLESGLTRIHLPGGEEIKLATGPGFFEVHSNRALVLVDDAVDVREIDLTRATAQLEEARAELGRLENGEVEGDRWRIEQKIKHAENQLAARGH
ncbi:MAG TPA: ATP synthase F1 subunit epsilon [Gaiellaceae bacterium]|jgi:F-type H+-transporting ATPase subunit epsilon